MISKNFGQRLFFGVAGLCVLAACGRLGGGSQTTDDCAAYAKYGDLQGKKVKIFGSIRPPQDASYIESFKPFEKCTGVKISYEGSQEFEAKLPGRVAKGGSVDLAMIPQPGLLKKLVATGKVVPAPSEVARNMDEYFNSELKSVGSVDGTFYAAPLGASVKSYVWYSPKAFAELGYSVPKSYAELTSLTERIIKDNPDGKTKPWCAGIQSGDATGWVATDWLEDLILRFYGPAVYDQWVQHEIPFNDQRVARALGFVGEILKNPERVNGGLGDVSSVAATSFIDAGKPLLNRTCWLHRQGDSYAVNWEDGGKTVVAPDGDVWAFYFPTVDPTQGKPVLIGGEFLAAFSDRPEVQAVQIYLSSLEWANAKARATPKTGGWVSANRKLDLNLIKSPIDQQSARILQDPRNEYRFDGSDLMPAAVGAGSFWTWMTKWVTGASDAEALDAIEESWPKDE